MWAADFVAYTVRLPSGLKLSRGAPSKKAGPATLSTSPAPGGALDANIERRPPATQRNGVVRWHRKT